MNEYICVCVCGGIIRGRENIAERNEMDYIYIVYL